MGMDVLERKPFPAHYQYATLFQASLKAIDIEPQLILEIFFRPEELVTDGQMTF